MKTKKSQKKCMISNKETEEIGIHNNLIFTILLIEKVIESIMEIGFEESKNALAAKKYLGPKSFLEYRQKLVKQRELDKKNAK